MNDANEPSSQPESEWGVPIPGTILPSDQWAKTAIKRLPAEGPLDWSLIFQRSSPIVLDIGCGNGRFVISSAVRRPEVDHLGIDILPVVIRYATRRGNQRGLWNARFAVCDGWTFLAKYVPRASVSEIHIYHPQPYHSPAEAERRMLTPAFLRLVHEALSDGGRVFLQTDNRPYWNYLRQTLPSFFEWQERTEPWPEDRLGRSRREILAIQRGMAIYRGEGTKRASLSSADLEALVASLPLPDFRSVKPKPKRRRGRGRGSS